MKNWLPFVLGPLFAIDIIPLALCCKRNSKVEKPQQLDTDWSSIQQTIPSSKVEKQCKETRPIHRAR